MLFAAMLVNALHAALENGEQSFGFEVVETVPVDDMLETENRWLEEHHGKPYCYNVARYADAPWLGRNHTDESKAKMSVAQKGKKHRLGQKSSPEHRSRMSASMKGLKKSPEHAEKIRQRMIGTSYAKGRIVSEAQRDIFRRPVVEVTTGNRFVGITEAAAHFGLHRANVSRTIRNGGLLKRGPNAGLHFQYAQNMI